jgi:outer membrane protein TolC
MRFCPTGALLALAGMAGCAAYQAAPLNLADPLQTSLQSLNHRLPDGGVISLAAPLSLKALGALAVLNDPDLAAARTQTGVAEADLLAAGLLPDPSLSFGFAALLGGPADAPAISGSLGEDVSALITYRVNGAAAQAGLAAVNAGILWQEWQVAAQAEQLAISVAGDDGIIASLRSNRAALAALNDATAAQVAAHNLTITEASASLAALAGTDSALDSAVAARAADLDQLDLLLDLQPRTEIAVALPVLPPFDARLAAKAIATLPDRRPDLIALRYGYEQADARLRAAILMQFLPINIGAAGGRDTSKVLSIGPQVTVDLPLFDRNQGGVAQAEASRAQLAAQFRASLASADAAAAALITRIGVLQRESAAADAADAAAAAVAGQAAAAQDNGALDARNATDLITAAAERRRAAIDLRAQLLTARLSLNTLLGIGLPALAGPAAPPDAS